MQGTIEKGNASRKRRRKSRRDEKINRTSRVDGRASAGGVGIHRKIFTQSKGRNEHPIEILLRNSRLLEFKKWNRRSTTTVGKTSGQRKREGSTELLTLKKNDTGTNKKKQGLLQRGKILFVGKGGKRGLWVIFGLEKKELRQAKGSLEISIHNTSEARTSQKSNSKALERDDLGVEARPQTKDIFPKEDERKKRLQKLL